MKILRLSAFQIKRKRSGRVPAEIHELFQNIDAATLRRKRDHGNAVGKFGIRVRADGEQFLNLLEIARLDVCEQRRSRLCACIDENFHDCAVGISRGNGNHGNAVGELDVRVRAFFEQPANHFFILSINVARKRKRRGRTRFDELFHEIVLARFRRDCNEFIGSFRIVREQPFRHLIVAYADVIRERGNRIGTGFDEFFHEIRIFILRRKRNHRNEFRERGKGLRIFDFFTQVFKHSDIFYPDVIRNHDFGFRARLDENFYDRVRAGIPCGNFDNGNAVGHHFRVCTFFEQPANHRLVFPRHVIRERV